MKLYFTKMQALGNDYIIIDGYKYPKLVDNASKLAKILSDRHFGVGGDGVIFVLPSDNADVMMRIFNADGSEAEMCGNGIRQVAKYIYVNNYVNKNEINVETLAGIKKIFLEINKNCDLEKISVNMGSPILNPNLIPVNIKLDGEKFAKRKLYIIDKEFEFTFVSMGNPHAVTFIENIDNFNVKKYGKFVENYIELFPKRTNVEFVEIINRNYIKMRVWERGSGETLACGTGACASVVAGNLNKLIDNKVTVKLLGGELEIEWENYNNVIMKGNSEIVFNGEIEINM